MGYRTITVQDACATRDLEVYGVTTPATQVHAAIALAFLYGEVASDDEFLGC